MVAFSFALLDSSTLSLKDLFEHVGNRNILDFINKLIFIITCSICYLYFIVAT